MLCNACNGIELQLEAPKADGDLIRQYHNIWDVKATATSCDFCRLIFDRLEWLEHPETAPYCRSRWGEKLWQSLLETSEISVYHEQTSTGDHNMSIRGLLCPPQASKYQEGPRACAVDRLLGGIYVRADSNFAHLIPGRPASPLVTRTDIIELLRSRYNECLYHHNRCLKAQGPSFTPRRVLEIRHNTVYLISTNGVQLPYIALSYCWGNTPSTRLTKNSLQSHINEGLPLSQLPQTISDACEISIGLGVRHIWVDCLCIIQDSLVDWPEQTASVAAIYNNSALTIKASAGVDSSQSLFQERSVSFQKSVELKSRGCTISTGGCFVRGAINSGLRENADKRAWILQESLLSRRIAIFGSGQLIWQCPSSHWNEGGMVLAATGDAKGIFPRPILGTSKAIARRSWEIGRSTTPSPDWKLSRLWENLVSDLCSRDMTFSKDKLPALSGLASWMQAHVNPAAPDRYLAGLWQSHLPGCLLWYHRTGLPEYTEKSRKPETYRAPSWSWAATDGDLEWIDWRSQKLDAIVTECQTTLKTANPFGEVAYGYLDIEAPLKRGSLVPDKYYVESFHFCDGMCRLSSAVCDLVTPQSEGALGSAFFDSVEYNRAWLGYDSNPSIRHWTCGCLRISEMAGLLVECDEEDDRASALQTYRRIGLVIFISKSAQEWWMTAQRVRLRLL